MKLQYNILWIDNDLKDYIENGSVDRIKNFLYERGFKPIVETLLDESELDNVIARYNYDIIISDYNLENTTGDKIIEDIRNVKKLDTDILFYSARTDYQKNNEVKNRLAFIERLTFHYGRERLLEKIERLIELSLRRLLDLNATRGLITAETSELDVEIQEIYGLFLSNILPSITEKNKIEKIEKIFKDDYKAVKKKHIKDCKNKRDCHCNNFNQYFDLSDSFRKWKLLKDLCDFLQFDKSEFQLSLLKRYNDEIISIRNKFAHVKSEEKNGKVVLCGKAGTEDFEFDEIKCIEIRKNIISHRSNIEILKNIVSSKNTNM